MCVGVCDRTLLVARPAKWVRIFRIAQKDEVREVTSVEPCHQPSISYIFLSLKIDKTTLKTACCFSSLFIFMSVKLTHVKKQEKFMSVESAKNFVFLDSD